MGGGEERSLFVGEGRRIMLGIENAFARLLSFFRAPRFRALSSERSEGSCRKRSEFFDPISLPQRFQYF